MNNKDLLYKKLNALRLEVHSSIVDDIVTTVDDLFGQPNGSKPLVVGSTVNEYYGIAMMLSDDEYSMCCLLQIGTGNTKETSNLVERWFPYSAMKGVITNNIDEEFYVRPQQFFKVKIIECENSIGYEFYQQEKTEDLVSLFEKPNYFEGLDISFLNGE